MKTIRQAVGSTVVAALLGLLMGCGMSPKAEAPRSEPEAAPAAAMPTNAEAEAAKDDAEGEPTTLADAEARLEKARADLDQLALNEPGAPAVAAGAPAPARPSALPNLAPARAEGRADKAASSSSVGDGASAPPAKAANTCETACKAFSSLARASDAVCRLDTDGGKRCERARQIRNDASRRVASCGCTK